MCTRDTVCSILDHIYLKWFFKVCIDTQTVFCNRPLLVISGAAQHLHYFFFFFLWGLISVFSTCNQFFSLNFGGWDSKWYMFGSPSRMAQLLGPCSWNIQHGFHTKQGQQGVSLHKQALSEITCAQLVEIKLRLSLGISNFCASKAKL